MSKSVTVDPVTVATVWHSLQTTCREARHLIKRTAQSYLIGQAQDVSVGIWDAKGNTVAVPAGLPVQFLGTSFAARAILELFEGDLKPGDVILSNDPYHDRVPVTTSASRHSLATDRAEPRPARPPKPK